MMMDIQLQNLFPWLQKKYEQKYGAKLQLLRKTFLVFYNLTQQIIEIYNNIYEQSTKLPALYEYSSEEQIQALRIVVHRTIIILHKLAENQDMVNNKAGAIDLSFCQKFIRNFGQNLNILCTYYHSLNHCEIVSNKFKFQKKKIVEGINRLYSVHNKIRQLFFKNDGDLKNIENQKQYIIANISHICIERQALYKYTRVIFNSVEDQTADFYDSFMEMMKYAKNTNNMVEGNNSQNSAEQSIRKLMKNYFRILHQFYEAQAELQYYLKPILNFCEQIKNKKKTMNYAVADAINNFSRITSQLLKSNYSLKNFKKIRMQQLNKTLLILLEQIISSNVGIDFKQSSQMLGHRIYKQLGIGIYGYQQRQLKQKEKQREKQKQRERQKQKQKQKQKEKQKQRDKRNKDKGKQKDKGKEKVSSQKQINISGSKGKGSVSPVQIVGKSKQLKQKLIQHQIQQSNEKEEEIQIQNIIKGQHEVKQQIKEYSLKRQTPQQKMQMVVDQISQCSTFIMDCMKELQKVQNSGLLNMIQQYKQKLNVNPTQSTNSNNNATNTNTTQLQNSKKLITKLCDYQKYISDYYKLHESIKEFQKILREIVLQEFNVKINVNISMEPNQYQLELMGYKGNQKQQQIAQINSINKNKKKT